jgi:OPA family glycerol-3-phosphate transporter-like MFS transporter
VSWNLSFLKPAPHIARLPDAEIKKVYPRLRWQILESTFIGYAVFYLVRNNLPVVSKEIAQSMHYSKGQIGDLLAVTALSYGLGKFLMGAWSDRSNPRYFMPLGLLLTAACNFAFAGVSNYSMHLFLWGLNGLAQSMGWAPCGRSLGHWYSIGERGTKFAFWNVAQNVGGGITGLVVAYSTQMFGWRSARSISSSDSGTPRSRSAFRPSRSIATTTRPAAIATAKRSWTPATCSLTTFSRIALCGCLPARIFSPTLPATACWTGVRRI